MAENTHTLQDLQQMQALPLKLKVQMTKRRISQWIDEFGTDGVYVAFSGGKDSTVLLHLAREIDPSIRGVFVDTGLEYPEIRNFVKTFDNVDWVKPKMNFKQVIQKYGYPFISKEVSETVYGARRYLTRQLQELESSRTNERTNEHTRIDSISCADAESLRHLTGGGVRQEMSATPRTRRIYHHEYRRLTGTGEYGEHP